MTTSQALSRAARNGWTALRTPAGGAVAAAGAGALLSLAGLRRGSLPGTFIALAGAGLTWRGLAGFGGSTAAARNASSEWGDLSVLVAPLRSGHRLAIAQVDRSPDDILAFLRDPGNLSRLRGPIEDVTVVDRDLYRWRLSAPVGAALVVTMRLTDEPSAGRLAWRAVEGIGGGLRIAVEVSPAASDGATSVQLEMEIPEDGLDSPVGRLFGPALDTQLRETLRRTRQLLQSKPGVAATRASAPPAEPSWPTAPVVEPILPAPELAGDALAGGA